MTYVPTAWLLTVPEAVAANEPAQLSSAVAPGSMNVEWSRIVIGLAPLSVMTGLMVSTTLTVRVTEAVLPPASVAVQTTWYTPGALTFTSLVDVRVGVAAQLSLL